MKSYIVYGKKEGLEQLVETLAEKNEITVVHKAKYVPIMHIESELPYEELETIFEEYTIAPPKEYYIDD